MINFKRGHELFWILEVLFLAPVAIFWSGVLSRSFGSDKIINAVVGQPMNSARMFLITIACPLAAAWIAHLYIKQNKKDKKASLGMANVARILGIVSILVTVIFMFAQNYSSM
jgi:uncharacterized membrane protein HdeD (DUF308 family)